MENILENELDRRMGCMFSVRKTTRSCAFFQSNKHFCNFMSTSSPPRIVQKVFRSNSVHFRFSYVSAMLMPWLGYLNELIGFWSPGDGRNGTCFFVISLVNLQYFPTVKWALTVLTMRSQCTPLRFGGMGLKQILPNAFKVITMVWLH
jgi:hypothetical protein